MGFLHKLWDETLAGPIPDDGLGKLRKYNSFSAVGSGTTGAPPMGAPNDDSRLMPVSRSITIVRSNGNRNLTVSVDSPSLPSSPSSTPSSPFSPNSPGGNFKKLTRRKSTTPQSLSPRDYDWIMLSALDR